MLKKKNIILIVYVFICVLVLLWFTSPLRIVFVNSRPMLVEVAKTSLRRQQGLQNRSFLKKNRGMLFVFKEEGWHSFWMKNTYIPLDIAFVDSNKIIVDIQQMIPLDTHVRYKPAKVSKYALEVNEGWFKENGIQVNDKLIFW